MIDRLWGRRYYGWLIVAVTALTLLVAAGVRSAPGVFIYPLEQDFGWSRAAISFAVALGLLLYGFAGPVAGTLIDRHGPRLLMLAGAVLMTAAMGLSVAMTELWQLNLLWGVLSGAGTGAAAAVLGAAVANRWFYTRRGFVMGAFGAATSAGQLVFVPLLMFLVVTLGWRGGALAMAAVTALILVPVLFVMRDDPADVGALPYGAQPGTAVASAAAASSGIMRRAIRTPDFWLLAGSFFVCGATSNGLIGTHFIPHSIDHGIPEVTAAGVLGLMGTMNFVGTIASGWLTDRYSPRVLLAAYYFFRGLSLFLLPFAIDVPALMVFAVLFGLDYIATVPPTAALVADIFGRRNVGVVFGWVFCAHQLGAALAASASGVIRDTMGSYGAAFLAAGVLAVIAALLSLRIRREPLAAGAESAPVGY